MPIQFFQQFQVKAEPPSAPIVDPGIPFLESTWHQPWSEPVRFKVLPRVQVARIASGPVIPILNPELQIIQFFESRWHQPWSEPKRFKLALYPARSPFGSSFFDLSPSPSTLIQGWYQYLREPVWPKKGLKPYLQQTLAYHPRYLPPANITVTMAVTETNADGADFDIWVYDEPPVPVDLTAVDVSISEVVADGIGGIASIKETE